MEPVRRLELGPSVHSLISSNKGNLGKIRAFDLTEQEFRLEIGKIWQNYTHIKLH